MGLIKNADRNACLSQLIHSNIKIVKQQDGPPIASPEEEIGNTSSDTASEVEGRPSLEQLWQQFSMKLGTTDAVHASLREGTLSGVLQPGERLAEERFARMFEVSRTSVHEAIVRLASEHLALRLGRCGFFVRRVAEADVQKLYMVRSMLDGLAASIAAQEYRHFKPPFSPCATIWPVRQSDKRSIVRCFLKISLARGFFEP